MTWQLTLSKTLCGMTNDMDYDYKVNLFNINNYDTYLK